MVGSWESYLGTLATMAMPEHWDYPRRGRRGCASRCGILREYLCVTFHRARQTGQPRGACGGRLARRVRHGALHPLWPRTYTLSSRPTRATSPGRRLASAWRRARARWARSSWQSSTRCRSLSPTCTSFRTWCSTPTAWSYWIRTPSSCTGWACCPAPSSQDELAASPTATELLNKATAREQPRQPARGPRARHQVRPGPVPAGSAAPWTRRSRPPRSSAPAPATASPCRPTTPRRTRSVLVPLCLVSDAQADCALVLAPQPSGNYRGITIMSLDRARVCARTVSAEQPRGLRVPQRLRAEGLVPRYSAAQIASRSLRSRDVRACGFARAPPRS